MNNRGVWRLAKIETPLMTGDYDVRLTDRNSIINPCVDTVGHYDYVNDEWTIAKEFEGMKVRAWRKIEF